MSKAMQVLRFVRDFREETGFSPTVREIGEALELSSTSTAWHHILSLKRAGYMTQVNRCARTMAVTESGQTALFADEVPA